MKLETLLTSLFEAEDTVIISIDKDLNILIDVDGAQSNINDLPDGYKAILSIVGSILVNCSNIGYRFDRIKNINGLMLIDEIENHLHVELQKVLLKY